MCDTVVITVAADNSLIGKSRANPWPGIRKVLQPATPPADGNESVMFTYRFMEEPTVSTDVQGTEAEPCAGGSACTSTDTVDSAVNALWTDEGWTADDCLRTTDREVLLYYGDGLGRAADVCQEAQLMAGNSVIYLNDEGPVERLLQWVAGICGGSGHACAEAQIMANNPYIYQNGLVHWLLR
ncbi:hypothetical protein VPH35_012545 [Triticum aestivum]|uniref:uncharacterized protein n=1 Tax=Triticum aestivum TaxID=4565 RepID=UPI001D01E373|nr:uncharacterized protein LOC123163121 [Triticum aestivum]